MGLHVTANLSFESFDVFDVCDLAAMPRKFLEWLVHEDSYRYRYLNDRANGYDALMLSRPRPLLFLRPSVVCVKPSAILWWCVQP